MSHSGLKKQKQKQTLTKHRKIAITAYQFVFTQLNVFNKTKRHNCWTPAVFKYGCRLNKTYNCCCINAGGVLLNSSMTACTAACRLECTVNCTETEEILS